MAIFQDDIFKIHQAQIEKELLRGSIFTDELAPLCSDPTLTECLRNVLE